MKKPELEAALKAVSKERDVTTKAMQLLAVGEAPFFTVAARMARPSNPKEFYRYTFKLFRPLESHGGIVVRFHYSPGNLTPSVWASTLDDLIAEFSGPLALPEEIEVISAVERLRAARQVECDKVVARARG